MVALPEEQLERQYAAVLEQCRMRGELNGRPMEWDRREHPRLKVNTSDFWITTVPEYSVLDLSATGIAIGANYPLPRGEVITVALGADCSAKAQVVACQLVDSPTEHQDAEFRIQCRFLERESGMALVVGAKYREMGAVPHGVKPS